MKVNREVGLGEKTTVDCYSEHCKGTKLCKFKQVAYTNFSFNLSDRFQLSESNFLHILSKINETSAL